ncbi:unnamed protein product [Paramecium octaurelia]|uniref:Uncharacterized protein n=1 Tax=Paramecium octaurelia TaxID=43137 RepID=A0A8S1VMQ1_PAROT|nr:unnamed protein product [Paramecium octaurelia]
MNTALRQPLSQHNSIDKRENKQDNKQDLKSFTFIKSNTLNVQSQQQSQQQLLLQQQQQWQQQQQQQQQQLLQQSQQQYQQINKISSQTTIIATTTNNNNKINNQIQDLETFIKEIDRLQLENQQLKVKAQEPQLIIQSDPKVAIENQDLKNQVDYQKQKFELQEKTHNETVRSMDLSWKQDVVTMKFQMEQQESKHRQALKQEQTQAKQEIARLQQNLTQISNSENKNQNLVSVLERQLINLKKSNNVLEEKLSQAIQQFDSQSKDQEFTLLKQQAIITSQEQHVCELKNKLGFQREQNSGLSNQLEKVKEVAEQKKQSENILTNKIKQVESDFDHLQQTYQYHKEQLQQKINELTGMYGKSQEQICLLQQQQTREQNQIKRLEVNLENEEKNHEQEVKDIHKSKQLLIEFLEQELLGYKEQNQQLKLVNQKLENQHQEQQQYFGKNFRELECKTNMLGEECSRLNNIIKQKDDQIYRLQIQLKDLMSLNGKNQNQEELLESLQIKEEEINLLKQQNESLINDLSRQTDNYRNLASQHKQLQKSAEDTKLNSITMNEFISKCELQEREVERLRMKVLEKSQLLEKVQKENLEYQAKLKSKLR